MDDMDDPGHNALAGARSATQEGSRLNAYALDRPCLTPRAYVYK